MKRIWTYLLSGVMALSMAAPAMAKDHGRDRDHHGSREGRERHHDRDDRYRRASWGDHDRRNGHPAGWDNGRKTGWHGGSLPPGQAKKHREYRRDPWVRDRRHHHHRRTAYVRRPIVTPRTNPYPTRTYPTQQPQHGRGPIPVPNVGQYPSTTAQKPSGQGGPIPVPR